MKRNDVKRARINILYPKYLLRYQRIILKMENFAKTPITKSLLDKFKLSLTPEQLAELTKTFASEATKVKSPTTETPANPFISTTLPTTLPSTAATPFGNLKPRDLLLPEGDTWKLAQFSKSQ